MESIIGAIKKHRLLQLAICLAFLSCFAILNASPLITKMNNPESAWVKQAIYYGLGFLIVFIISRVGNDVIYEHIKLIYIIFIVLLIGLAFDHRIYLLFGRHVVPFAHMSGGATSWYNFPGFSFQPSEFMKVILVIYLSKITTEYNDYILVRTLDSELRYVFECMKVVLPVALLVYLQNDSGVVLIILMGVLFVFFGSGIRDQWFIIGVVAIGIIVGIFVYLYNFQPVLFAKFFSTHTLNRFYGWTDPEGTIGNQGYQLFYSLLSFGTAGIFGHGFQSVIKVFPEAQTDFIFAVILTDYGLVGGLITIALVTLFDLTILKLGLDSDNETDKYFVLGIFGMLIFQQIWNMFMVVGLLPITGITLPFISYGGSSLLSYMIAIGMLINIDSQNILAIGHKK